MSVAYGGVLLEFGELRDSFRTFPFDPRMCILVCNYGYSLSETLTR